MLKVISKTKVIYIHRIDLNIPITLYIVYNIDIILHACTRIIITMTVATAKISGFILSTLHV